MHRNTHAWYITTDELIFSEAAERKAVETRGIHTRSVIAHTYGSGSGPQPQPLQLAVAKQVIGTEEPDETNTTTHRNIK